jgi:biotin carboxyl carrier protein
MKRELTLNGSKVEVDLLPRDGGAVSFTWQGKSYRFEVLQQEGEKLVLRDGEGRLHRLWSNGQLVVGEGRDAEFTAPGAIARKGAVHGGGLTAPMPGKIFRVLVNAGDEVKAGQTLLVLEAMKMEHAIKAPQDGKIKQVLFSEGQQVTAGAALVQLEVP